MIGIYQDSFVDYLRDMLGDHIKTSSKNIITPCPFCELGKEKSHYHMYISLEAPIFHCFKGECEESGNLRKLLKRIEGRDISKQFIDQKKLEEFSQRREVFVDKEKEIHKIFLPPLKENVFINKELYIQKRMNFANIPSSSLKGLIYDVEEFIKINNIPVDETLFRLQDYLHSNFVGFLTEHNSTVVFRNIDHTHGMRYFKLKIRFGNFLDYYKLPGNKYISKKIVLAEGIFDILSSQIHDSLNIKDDVKLYASALSSKYISLIHSIIFYEQIFQPDIIILSDKGISLDHYKKMKYFNKHIVNSLTVYYNKAGKDFGDTPVIPVKYII